MTSRKLILKNHQAPGDILMLTAAVRDLSKAYPGEFLIDVDTSCPALWENNPYLTPLDPKDPSVEILPCEYPLIHRSHHEARHFLHGFIDNLSQHLRRPIPLTEFKGDLHLSPSELERPSPIQEFLGCNLPYWILVAGGKYDYTIKWWHPHRFQAVVDHFAGKIAFIQIGEPHHFHPGLEGVLDRRGQTPIRELLRYVYHAQGVLCPVTFLMHLAAAVPTRPHAPKARPCVVIAGGREPPHWEAYPTHQFIHNLGTLWCCTPHACWRSRTLPLNDGDLKDSPEHLCLNVVNHLPQCMNLITPEQVSDRIQNYFRGNLLSSLQPDHWQLLKPHLSPSLKNWMLP